MRERYVIGNWKLNGSLSGNALLLNALKSRVATRASKRCGICVPYPYLEQVKSSLAGTSIVWGSQDVSSYKSGAYTGEVSAAMAAEFGCGYALVGHSERRTLFGDTDAVVAQKFSMARLAGLTPILCVGETLAEREAGQTQRVVGRQLQAVIEANGIAAMADVIVAYEPVWAIGTGKTSSPENAQTVHAYLRSSVSQQNQQIGLNLPILYGGSVKQSNAATLFSMPDIDGGLIGGASLVADEFVGIWDAL